MVGDVVVVVVVVQTYVELGIRLERERGHLRGCFIGGGDCDGLRDVCQPEG